MTTVFKKGDRVRLKAWVTKAKLGGLDRLFPQGCVGIVTRTQGCVQGIRYLDLKVPTLEKSYHRVCVAVEDLELMPERQVHVVKDGKVYELRDNETTQKFACKRCDLCAKDGYCSYVPAPCLNSWNTNFQEVTSGKLVS